jgi:hypothetical protein
MANPIAGVSNAQHVAQVAQTAQPTKQQAPAKTAAPHDTVTISPAGKAASQAQQGQQAAGDGDHGGNH